LKAESEHPNAETKLIQPLCTSNKQCGDCLCVNGFCDCKSDFKRKGMKFEDFRDELQLNMHCKHDSDCHGGPGCWPRCINLRCRCGEFH
ncbi:hypothetical protein HN51_065311, partial [Arachis hypogaea]